MTIYDVNTRTLIQSSRIDLLKNADGSIDLHAGPTAPAGFEKNRGPSVLGQAWFCYFRLYAPTEVPFDRTWVLPDFEKVK